MWSRKRWAAAAAVVCGLALAAMFWKQAAMVGRIVLGGAILAMLLEPLAGKLARYVSRGSAAAIAVAGMAAAFAGLAALIAPVILRQAAEVMSRWGAVRREAENLLARTLERFGAKESRVALELVGKAVRSAGLGDGDAAEKLARLAAGGLGGAVRIIAEAGMMVLVAFYMLRDMDALSLRLEWMLPSRGRMLGLKMASAIRGELGAYLRGQLTISLTVAGLAAAGMWIAGTPGFLALGTVVGLFNMIPYFGPLIGAVPALLSALGQGLGCTLNTAIALFVVQQIDGYFVSPRLVGQSTGLHPALVLLGISFGGGVAGPVGMLLAAPVMLIIRSVARIWSLRHEIV